MKSETPFSSFLFRRLDGMETSYTERLSVLSYFDNIGKLPSLIWKVFQFFLILTDVYWGINCSTRFFQFFLISTKDELTEHRKHQLSVLSYFDFVKTFANLSKSPLSVLSYFDGLAERDFKGFLTFSSFLFRHTHSPRTGEKLVFQFFLISTCIGYRGL